MRAGPNWQPPAEWALKQLDAYASGTELLIRSGDGVLSIRVSRSRRALCCGMAGRCANRCRGLVLSAPNLCQEFMTIVHGTVILMPPNLRGPAGPEWAGS